MGVRVAARKQEFSANEGSVELNSESVILARATKEREKERRREDEVERGREGGRKQFNFSPLRGRFHIVVEETRRVAVYYIFPLLANELMDRWK